MKLINKKPILVTGSHRCGSTWVGEMLSLSPQAIYLDEIFNPDHGLVQHKKVFDVWFKYITDSHEGEKYRTILRNAINFHAKRAAKNRLHYWMGRPLLKDPIAAFSSEWFAHNFDMDVIILFRHPAAFASSLKRLDWHFDFRNFLNQEQLMKDHLSSLRALIQKTHNDIIEEAAVLWLCIYTVLDNFIGRNSDWIVKRHEDISLAPLKEYKEIYKRLGLLWTQQASRRISESSSRNNPSEAPDNIVHHLHRDSKSNTRNWKSRLTDGEICRIRDIVEPLSNKYYEETDW